MTFDRQAHWERIYSTKDIHEFSWYEEKPLASLDFLAKLKVSKAASIIDIGGGDSFFVDHLLDMGYTDITVLDISETAIRRAQERLGEKGRDVKWIVADVAQFSTRENYDVWHDRAAFHFLTDERDIDSYVTTVQNCVKPDGVLLMATFSETGPETCSGVEIRQYSETSMAERLKRFFSKIRCVNIDHITPFNTIQNFIFCSFRRLSVQGTAS